MNIILVLLCILFVLMVCIGRERGFQAFSILIADFFILFVMIYFICWGFNVIHVTVISVVIISTMILFCVNGNNKKTLAAFISVLSVITTVMIIAYNIGMKMNIQGFSNEDVELTSTGLTMNVDINFHYVVLFCIAVGVLGAVIDVAISISSAMEQVFMENSKMTKSQLFMSGMSIGRDVLGAMINTMLFAYIGGFMTLLMFFYEHHYKFTTILNLKIFSSEIFEVICSGIGIVLTIPITAFIASIIYTYNKNKSVEVTS